MPLTAPDARATRTLAQIPLFVVVLVTQHRSQQRLDTSKLALALRGAVMAAGLSVTNFAGAESLTLNEGETSSDTQLETRAMLWLAGTLVVVNALVCHRSRAPHGRPSLSPHRYPRSHAQRARRCLWHC